MRIQIFLKGMGLKGNTDKILQIGRQKNGESLKNERTHQHMVVDEYTLHKVGLGCTI